MDANALLSVLRDGDPRDLGRVAQDHSAAEIVAAIEPLGGVTFRDTRRALAVELALRGKGIDRSHPIVRAILREHPVSGPPPWLLPIERELPGLIVDFGSFPGALGRARVDPRVEADWLREAGVAEVTAKADLVAIETVVAPWVAESNGRVEARVFVLEGAQGRHPQEALLRCLSLAAVPTPSDALEVVPLTPSNALARLFFAAHGGAYGSTVSASVARDRAWTSLRALIGVPAHLPAEEVEVVTARCGFTSVFGTEFFNNVAWDLGLAVVSAGSDRLAILCATDTD